MDRRDHAAPDAIDGDVLVDGRRDGDAHDVRFDGRDHLVVLLEDVVVIETVGPGERPGVLGHDVRAGDEVDAVERLVRAGVFVPHRVPLVGGVLGVGTRADDRCSVRFTRPTSGGHIIQSVVNQFRISSNRSTKYR